MHVKGRRPRRSAGLVIAVTVAAAVTTFALGPSHPAVARSATRVRAHAHKAHPSGQTVGASAEQPFPGDAALTGPEPPNSGGRRPDRQVAFTLKTADGLGLRDGWYHSTDHWTSQVVPPAAITTGYGSGSVTGWDPGMVAAYQIYDAAGKATDYWIGAKFYSPYSGGMSNHWHCVVYKGNPRTTGRSALLSPYACVWTDVRGNNPSPVLTVSEGTVVTDKAQAGELLTKYCNHAAAQRDCAFINFGYSTALGEAKVVGNVVRNIGSSPAKHTVGWEDTQATTNSVGIELTVSVGFWEVWKAALTAKYEHTWETSHTFNEHTEVEVGAQSVSWLEFAPNMQTSVGTWVIRADNKHYVIPQVSVSGALPHGGRIDVHECPLANYHNGVCSGGLTTIAVKRQ